LSADVSPWVKANPSYLTAAVPNLPFGARSGTRRNEPSADRRFPAQALSPLSAILLCGRRKTAFHRKSSYDALFNLIEQKTAQRGLPVTASYTFLEDNGNLVFLFRSDTLTDHVPVPFDRGYILLILVTDRTALSGKEGKRRSRTGANL